MSGRKYPWVLAPVPWSPDTQFTRGTLDGLVLLSWGIGPRDMLATRRQLRAQGLRPGGTDPVAVLYFRCRKAAKQVFANLYLVADAKPVRAMTPAKWASVHKALTARRTCTECGEDSGYYLPRDARVCEGCRYSAGQLDEADYLHDYLVGELTIPSQRSIAAATSEVGQPCG